MKFASSYKSPRPETLKEKLEHGKEKMKEKVHEKVETVHGVVGGKHKGGSDKVKVRQPIQKRSRRTSLKML